MARHHKEVAELETTIDSLRIELVSAATQKQKMVDQVVELQQQVALLGGERRMGQKLYSLSRLSWKKSAASSSLASKFLGASSTTACARVSHPG